MRISEFEGWVKIHRRIMEWEWYDSLEVFKLFMHCILRANHKAAKWQGIEIRRGEFITSISRLSRKSGLSVQETRTALKKLQETGEIETETTSRYTRIIVRNYCNYQRKGGKATSKQETKEKHASNTRTTTNNNEVETDIEF